MDQFRLTLVDGFAGGGMYRDAITKEDRFGSPLLMLRAMRDANLAANNARKKEFKLDIEYFFIEKDRGAFEHLKTTLQGSEFRSVVEANATLFNDTFKNRVGQIVEHIRSQSDRRRAIFVLDQFGYSDVPMPQLRNILSELENAEIILTFATDSLIDYLSSNETTQKLLENVGIPIGKNEILTLKQQQNWRQAIQRLLHRGIHENSGAKYYTPFFIRSKDAHRDFWLIHLSGHAKARDVMVGLHWSENTSSAHYGRSGLGMLGYDPTEDFRLTGQPVFFFDESARSSTHEALMGELPAKIHEYRKQGGVPFDTLFANLTNESPATSEIFRGVIAELVKEGEIEVGDKTSTKNRRLGVQHGSDIIVPSKQKKIRWPRS